MKEAVILAGGLGTRLQSVVSDVPKCMAEVAGHPFLYYLFDYLEKQQYNHIILSLGYKSEIVIDWLKKQNRTFKISYVIEDTPLGTGGAIKLAFDKVISDMSFVLNGDTFFDINSVSFEDFHKEKQADISIALKPMADFDRYGSVDVDNNDRIIGFNEKKYCALGLINGGVYIINKNIFDTISLPENFSFEKEILESRLNQLLIYGYKENSYFIDIGIPSDYRKAKDDFKTLF